MHLSMSSPRGGEVWHRVGILTFSKKKIIKIPTPGQRIFVKISRNKWFLLIYSLKLTDQMHDVRSKSPPWGYASRSNSSGLPGPPPLGLDIDRCIKKQQTWTRLVNWGNCNSTSEELNKVGLWERINMYVTEILSNRRTHLSSPSVCRYVFFPLVLYFPAANTIGTFVIQWDANEWPCIL